MRKLILLAVIFLPISAGAQSKTAFGINLYIEEDNFNSHFNQDRNYTGGGAINMTGEFTTSNWFIAPYFRNDLDHLLHVNNIFRHYLHRDRDFVSSSFEFGTTLFTPENLATSLPVIGDRPYASLAFISSKSTRIWGDKSQLNDRFALTTELNLGVLGTNIGDSIQTWIHRSIMRKHPGNPNNRPLPQGWKNQISNGGEPTAMYRLTIQNKIGEILWDKGTNIKAIELSGLYEGELGYYTNLAVGLTCRVGYFNTNFWENSSNFGNRGNQFAGRSNISSPLYGAGTADRNFFEFFGFISARSRLIGYNALLEGQFKKSVYTLDSKQINHLVNEFEIGAAARVWRFTFIYEPLAGRTSEINTDYTRTHIWGAFNFSYNCPIKN